MSVYVRVCLWQNNLKIESIPKYQINSKFKPKNYQIVNIRDEISVALISSG